MTLFTRTSIALAGLLCLFSVCLHSQSVLFQNLDDRFVRYDMLEMADGYLIAGETSDETNTFSDALLIKMDKTGHVLWKRRYGQLGDDGFAKVVPANDGGLIAWGYTKNSDNNMNAGWLVKLDDAGNLLWQKIISESAYSHRSTGKVVVMSDGYIVCGLAVRPNSTQTFVMRVHNNGETLWSRLIPDRMQVQYVADNVLYLTGSANLLACWRSMNATTGQLIGAYDYLIDVNQAFMEGYPTPDGNHLLAGSVAGGSMSLPNLRGWVQKVDPQGQIVWSKHYNIKNSSGSIRSCDVLADGSAVFSILYNPSLKPSLSYTGLVKIDPDGAVVWARSFGSDCSVFSHRLSKTTDGGFMLTGNIEKTVAGISDSDAFWMKTDSMGIVGGCCAEKMEVTVQDVELEPFTPSIPATPFDSMALFNLAISDTATLQILDFCANESRVISDTILFCPGETVTIQNNTYTQPGTLQLVIPSTTGGCDTLATYTLQHKTANQPNTLQLACPANVTVTAASGASGATVSYEAPVATSNCPCPDMLVNLSSGGASGTTFPVGVHQVCYRAEDACGYSKTCCFTVQVAAEQASSCDEKTNGCVQFQLMSIQRDAGQNWVYRIRITNQCSAAVTYAYLQAPSGVPVLEPANNNLYTGASGAAYTVRNPNFSPFYSVRFQPVAAGLGSGQSEVFRYVLPRQVDIDYIRVAVRLASGVYTETHLNTFFCPVGSEPANQTDDRSASVAAVPLQVIPNPAASGSTLFLTGTPIPDGVFVLQDVMGRVVSESPILENQVVLEEAVAAGMYFFKVLSNGGVVGKGKLSLF